jgi:GMP synthase PP-ATPase subunit
MKHFSAFLFGFFAFASSVEALSHASIFLSFAKLGVRKGLMALNFNERVGAMKEDNHEFSVIVDAFSAFFELNTTVKEIQSSLKKVHLKLDKLDDQVREFTHISILNEPWLFGVVGSAGIPDRLELQSCSEWNELC